MTCELVVALAGFDLRFLEVYRDRLKGVQILLSNSQAGKAEKFSKSRKKFLATKYHPFSRSLYSLLLGRAGRNFSQPRAHLLVHLCISIFTSPRILLMSNATVNAAD